jgi:rhodanese-related sulfurtransferase
MPVININAQQLNDRIKTESIELIDVREPDEYSEGHIESAKLIPMDQVASRIDEIDWNKKVVFYCRSGARSLYIASKIVQEFKKQIFNLSGGINDYLK